MTYRSMMLLGVALVPLATVAHAQQAPQQNPQPGPSSCR